MRNPYHRRKQIKPLFYPRGPQMAGAGTWFCHWPAGLCTGALHPSFLTYKKSDVHGVCSFNTERLKMGSRERNTGMCLLYSNCWLLLLPHL